MRFKGLQFDGLCLFSHYCMFNLKELEEGAIQQRLTIIGGYLTDFQFASPLSHDRFKFIHTWRTIQKPPKFRFHLPPHG